MYFGFLVPGAVKVAHKDLVATTRKARDIRRRIKREEAERKADQERERILNEITGRVYRQAEEAKRRHAGRATVAACIKHFVMERRNDFSAEAIAAMLDMPDAYPVEFVAEILDNLKASGDYDRIIAEKTGTGVGDLVG
jgi:hypothetical protein